MKLDLETPADRSAPRRGRPRPHFARLPAPIAIALGLALGLAVGLAIGLSIASDSHRAPGRWLAAAGHFVDAALNAPPLPALVLDIDFDELQALHAQRRTARAHGSLAESDAVGVPAMLGIATRRIRVEVSLVGPGPAHYGEPDRWSLRVATKGRARVLGAHDFALLVPEAVGSEAPLLRLSHTSLLGLPVPEHGLVEVMLNGEGLGPMLFVEDFSADVLERRGWAESAILGLDADDAFASVTPAAAPEAASTRGLLPIVRRALGACVSDDRYRT